MATDHAQSLRLGQRPAAATPGVQLVAVASLPAVAYRGQLVYALDIDEFRVFDGDAWQIPTAATTGGLQMFVQSTAPVADNVGDFWLKDTTYQIYVWDGTSWQEVQDPTADAAAAAAAAAQVDATDALGLATNAQATADGKITAFYQSLEPVLPGEDPQEGDIWYRTSDNRAFIYNSGAFVEIQDQDIVDALTQAGTAQATADQKISSYFQTTAPWANGAGGHGNDIGDLWYDTDDNNKPYRWDGNWTAVQDGTIAIAQTAANTAQSDADAAQAAADAAQAAADAAMDAATTDGSAPSTSPTPVSFAGVGFFLLKWDAIVNADPVMYEAHVSTISGFTADSGTYVGQTSSTQFNVKALPGSPPADPSDPDPRLLDYDTVYYAVLIAKDGDGAAAQSAEVACTLARVTGVDLAVDSVTAANILAGTITGDLLDANMIVAGQIQTAEDGQRVRLGTNGLQGYKPDDSLMLSLPTDGSEGLIDLEVVARGLTAQDGASLYGASELNADSTLTLQTGITGPSSTPVAGVIYDAVQPSTASLSTATKTGSLGAFNLVASEISCIEWRTTLSCFSMFQVRPGGTREWYIDTTGAPVNVSGIGYYLDWVNWEIWSSTELLGTGTPAKNGHYLMFRYMPTQDYYCQSANGNLWRYSRQNGTCPPVMGNNGSDVFVAEVISSTHLFIRYFTLTGAGGNFPASTTNYESSQGFLADTPLACCINYTFDVGARYLTANRSVSTNARLLVTSGTNANSIFPGGSSNNWASANAGAETFEAPSGNRRSMTFDGTNIWSMHGDGFLYKHSNEHWDPAVSSSTYWAKETFYDSVGTTHETMPGSAKSYTAKRRSNNFYTVPTIPTGGADDPNQMRLYMARGATAPINTAYHLQYTGSTNTTWTTMATATANPPTSNNFPGATAAKITNASGTLVIDATGDVTGVDGAFTTMAISGTATKGGNTIAVEGPYYYAWVSSASASATGVTTTVIGYTTLSNSGITLSSGVFTLPRAGRYNLYGQLTWAGSGSPAGARISQWQQNSTNVASTTVAAQSTTFVNTFTVPATATIVAAASDTVQFKWTQNAGTAGPQIATRDLSFIMISYIGA